MRRPLGYEGPQPFPTFSSRESPQICVGCSAATGITQADGLYDDNGRGPLCEECYDHAMGLEDPEDTEELNFDRG